MPDTYSGGDDRSEALARFLAGESSPEEQAGLRQWLAEDPRREAELRALQALSQRMAFTPPANLDVDAAWRRAASRLGETDVSPLSTIPRRRPSLAAIAAVVAVVSFGGFQLWRWFSAHVTPAQVYTTAVGTRDSIRFEDGGRIVLAPGTRLTARHQPGTRPGEVVLEGEAYFEIPHDPARPFRVRAGGAEITDLGTVFSVRGQADAGVEVRVMKGSVALRQGEGTGARVVLEPGDRGSMSADGRITTTRDSEARGTPSWMDGRLEFHNAPLAEVQADLRRWYGIELRLADSTLVGRHLTASFHDEPVSQVLAVIALTLGASVDLRRDTALLRLPGIPASR